VRSEEEWEFTTWWRDDIRTGDMLTFEGKNYNIRKVENVLKRNKFLRMLAEAGVEQ
jgi:hypothetical protein